MKQLRNATIRTSTYSAFLRVVISVICILAASPVTFAQSIIRTFAGGIAPIDGLPALGTNLGYVARIISDDAGGFYVSTDSSVIRVTADGLLHTIAGNGVPGFSGDGGPAKAARLNYPQGIVLDKSGNLYISDSFNHRIRKINLDGTIRTIAGNGAEGFSGDGGPATAATFSEPADLAVNAAGDVFIADLYNNRVRKISPDGVIHTIAGNGSFTYSGDGVPAVSAGVRPSGLALDSAENLYIADASGRIRRVTADGTIRTVVGTGVSGFNGDGGPATAASISFPVSVVLDRFDNLYIADTGNNRVRMITAGKIFTVAGNGISGTGGDGGLATAAQLSGPSAIAVDGVGSLLIVTSHFVRKVTPNGIITTVAGSDAGFPVNRSPLNPLGITFDATGNLLVAEFSNGRISRISEDGVIGTFVDGRTAPDFQPTSLAIDAAGNVLATDNNAGLLSRIDRISPSGVIDFFLSDGQLYFFDYDGQAPGGQLCVAGIVVDSAGNVYIAETFRQKIWKWTPSGTLSVIASGLSYPNGLALDRKGNLYFADSYSNQIRKLDTNGNFTTVAGNGTAGFSGDGGPATAARLSYPLGVVVDSSGSLFIADSSNNRVRMVTPDGIITTIAGNGAADFSGDGGTPEAAALNYPSSLAIDSRGNLFIADQGNGRIREIVPAALLAPLLTGISVTNAIAGATIVVQLQGSGFDESMSVNAGPGVSVSKLAVLNSRAAAVTLTIDSNAPLGAHNLVVSNAGFASNEIGFSVILQPAPVVTSVNPGAAGQGSSWSASLRGSNLASGMIWNFGSGITVSNVTIVSDSLAIANLLISPTAAKGNRSVSVSTAGGTSNSVTFTIGPPTLTVSKSGNGDGTVTSSPPGIHCGESCATTFTTGQVFALSVTPSPGSVFSGWSGDPDCSDGNVTMTSAQNCIARFDRPQSGSTLLRGDFDGDGKTDIAAFRPSSGEWFARLSSKNYTVGSGNWYFQWGIPGDFPVNGDFDGDGKTDIAVFRPSSGEWFLRLSSRNYDMGVGNWYFRWGLPGDVPLAGDFDGDRKADIAVFRPSTGEWFLRLSTQNYAIGAGSWYFQWGISGDVPVIGDFDGDLRADIAVYRPTTGQWFLRFSSLNYAISAGNWYFQWGLPGDEPIAGDFDGDGNTDIAVFRPTTGEWFIRLSTQNYNIGAGNWYFHFGHFIDEPVVGDFDGDGKSDFAVYRPLSGEWYIRLSSINYALDVSDILFQWGLAADFPLPR